MVNITNLGPPSGPVRRPTLSIASRPAAPRDPRWPAVAAALAQLREKGRYSVRLVDAECGAGVLLLQAVRHASALGFLAIEARGIGASPTLIGRARTAAARISDPAIGVEFEIADLLDALAAEREMPADIILWHGVCVQDHRPALLHALQDAGNVVIGDRGRPGCGTMAA